MEGGQQAMDSERRTAKESSSDDVSVHNTAEYATQCNAAFLILDLCMKTTETGIEK